MGRKSVPFLHSSVFLWNTRKVFVLNGRPVGNSNPRPLPCQRGNIKYSQQLTGAVGTAKYLIIPRSRTHLRLAIRLQNDTARNTQ